MVVYTIGHSNHPPEKLRKLLADNRIEILMDVRSQPGSRRVPHANPRSLQLLVGHAGMEYLAMGDSLGGRPKDESCYDPQTGEPNYVAIQDKDFFREGLFRLLTLASGRRVCIMCAEEDPKRCHRTLLIGEALKIAGVELRHIRGSGEVQPDEHLSDRRVKTPSAQLPLRLDDCT